MYFKNWTSGWPFNILHGSTNNSCRVKPGKALHTNFIAFTSVFWIVSSRKICPVVYLNYVKSFVNGHLKIPDAGFSVATERVIARAYIQQPSRWVRCIRKKWVLLRLLSAGPVNRGDSWFCVARISLASPLTSPFTGHLSAAWHWGLDTWKLMSQ